MPQQRTSRAALAAVVVCALAGATPFCRAADEAAKTPAAPAAAAPAGHRTEEQIAADLQASVREMQEAMGSPAALLDPAKRSAVAPKAIPVIKKLRGLFNELSDVNPMAKAQLGPQTQQLETMLVLLGDADAKAKTAQQAQSKDPAEAVRGRTTQWTADWLGAGKDTAAQQKLVATAQALAKDYPQDDTLAITLASMGAQSAATPELKDQLMKIVTTDLKGRVAQQIAAQSEGEQKLKNLAGKPLTLTGTTVDGKPFTTADWKGKVVLVDFWATWCGPCRAELPRVKKAYADFHPKGLEILGVSNDFSAEALTKFLAENKDMPWPNLFDAAAAAKHEWNPTTTGFGIDGIPTMFLIDKHGVLRTVEARENFEELIPKMLDEKDAAK